MSSSNRANQETIIKLLGGNLPGDEQDNFVFVTNLDPLSGYKFTDGIEGASTSYFGNVNKDGKWYIQRLINDPISSRYVFGEIDYNTAWTNRESLTYQIFSEAI